jgi:hypothetical protein
MPAADAAPERGGAAAGGVLGLSHELVHLGALEVVGEPLDLVGGPLGVLAGDLALLTAELLPQLTHRLGVPDERGPRPDP